MTEVIKRRTVQDWDPSVREEIFRYQLPVGQGNCVVQPKLFISGHHGEHRRWSMFSRIDRFQVTAPLTFTQPLGDDDFEVTGYAIALVEGETLSISLRSAWPLRSTLCVRCLLISSTAPRPGLVDAPLPVQVFSNFGGLDHLSYQDAQGRGIEEAQVEAYLESDFDITRRPPGVLQGATTTRRHGRWVAPLTLAPGTYVLYYYKHGEFGPDTTVLRIQEGFDYAMRRRQRPDRGSAV